MLWYHTQELTQFPGVSTDQEFFPLQPKNAREELLDSWLALTEEGHSCPGPIRLPVFTGSMLPGIPVNSIIQIEKTEARYCRRGDVVVYRDKERLVVHRLLLRLGWGSTLLFYEKGDSNPRGGWIKGSQIRGRVLTVEFPDESSTETCTPDLKRALSSLKADFFNRMLAFPRWIKHSIQAH